VTPSVLKPLVQMATNENSFGSPIYPDQPKFGPEKHAYELAFNSNSGPSKAIAKTLYDYTGTDWHPGTFDYSLQSLFGGLGKTALQATNTVSTLASGQLPAPRDVPFLSSFDYSEHPSAQAMRYFQNEHEVTQAHENIQSAIKMLQQGDRAGAQNQLEDREGPQRTNRHC